MQQDGCDVVQKNGQLKYCVPPPSEYCLVCVKVWPISFSLANYFMWCLFFYADWEGPPPSKGCEVLVVKLPRVVSLEELYRVFSPIGKNCFH